MSFFKDAVAEFIEEHRVRVGNVSFKQLPMDMMIRVAIIDFCNPIRISNTTLPTTLANAAKYKRWLVYGSAFTMIRNDPTVASRLKRRHYSYDFEPLVSGENTDVNFEFLMGTRAKQQFDVITEQLSNPDLMSEIEYVYIWKEMAKWEEKDFPVITMKAVDAKGYFVD